MNHFTKLTDLHRTNGYPPPENRFISLITCTSGCSVPEYTSDFYTIGFKKLKSGDVMYGRTRYDHDHGSLSFMKPRQIVELRDIQLEQAGFLIHFHENLLHGHALHTAIKHYGYFEYESNEALALMPKEEAIIWDLFTKIETEYHANQDEYSRDIMLTHIDSILKYAERFYRRQFIHRAVSSGKTVSRFNEALSHYIAGGSLQAKGLPTVKSLADSLNMSSRYLNDLLKQETGKTALELIHIFLISEAKHLLTIDVNSISEIAYSLGFENPPYFSRLFKKSVGLTPLEFKRQSLN